MLIYRMTQYNLKKFAFENKNIYFEKKKEKKMMFVYNYCI